MPAEEDARRHVTALQNWTRHAPTAIHAHSEVTDMKTRSQRAAPLFGPALALSLVAMPLQAQGFWDPPGDDDPCGNPMLECLDGGTRAADAVGGAINERLESGDCTGMGPRGCLGLALHKVMCQVDDREWVREACRQDSPKGDPPEGDPPEGDPPEGDPPAGDPPKGDPPKKDPPTKDPPESQESRSTPSAVLESAEVNRRLRAWLGERSEGRPLYTLRIGDRPAYRFHLAGRYEHRRQDDREYYAVLRAVQVGTERERKVVVGGEGNLIYAMDHEWLGRAAGGRR